MVCYPYARDHFKNGTPNGRYASGGGDLLPKEQRKDDVREMRVLGSMSTLPGPKKAAGKNRAKRHRLNPGRRTVAANRAART
jgi:hypothetical protein